MPATLGLAAACAAVPAVGENLPKQAVVDDFGACLVRVPPVAAKAFMATELGSPKELKAGKILAQGHNSCIGSFPFLSMQVGAMRGAIAEAYLRADTIRMAGFSAAAARLPVRAAKAQGRQFVMGYARCLADADEAKAAALIQTGHSTVEERAAFLAFGQGLADCMPLAAEYRVNVPDVRNHIAVRLYQLAFDGSSTAGQGGRNA